MNNTDPTKNLDVNTFDWCWNPDLPTAIMCDHQRRQIVQLLNNTSLEYANQNTLNI
jgi:hypothetical protein